MLSTETMSATRPVAFGRTASDLWVSALVLLFVVAFAPATMFPSWTPRMALLVCTALPGVAVFAWHGVVGDRLARLAWSFVGMMMVAAAVSDAVRSSIIGFVGRDLSVIIVAASFGLWALARSVSPVGRRLVADVFMGAAATVAVIGVVQVAANIETGSLALQGGRPMSLLVNPVYFGAICAAGAVAASRAAGPRIGWYHCVAALTAVACVLSGSRVAWAAVIVLVAIQVGRERSRERAYGAAAVLAGLSVGLVLDRVFSGGANSVDRVTGESAGRFTVWGYGIESWFDRPVLGHGVGLFRPAVQGRFSTEFVRTAALDESRQPWFDAHNVVIGTLVATGIVGLVVLAAWAYFAARSARGPAAWALAAIAMTWLLQPVSLATLPVAMILLGVASSISEPAERMPAGAFRWVLVPAAAVSLLLGVGLFVADLRLKAAVDEPSVESASAAARWFPGDPVVANVVAQVAKLDGGNLRANPTSIAWRERSTEREPDRPYWWNLLAEEQLHVGELDAAQRAIDEALRLQPTNYASNRLALDIAVLQRDRPAIEKRIELLCELDDRACEIDPDEVLAFDG